jgi:hypothetical protein
MEILELFKKNITYDKIANKTEFEQFYKNLDLIRKEIPNISKNYL